MAMEDDDRVGVILESTIAKWIRITLFYFASSSSIERSQFMICHVVCY